MLLRLLFAPQVFSLLLEKVHMRYVLALPAVLALHAAVGRDLQALHATSMFPRLMAALGALLDEQGGDRDADVMEHVSACWRCSLSILAVCLELCTCASMPPCHDGHRARRPILTRAL
jgi:hypothetical protein